jgi:putative ABC transport system permease protein
MPQLPQYLRETFGALAFLFGDLARLFAELVFFFGALAFLFSAPVFLFSALACLFSVFFRSGDPIALSVIPSQPQSLLAFVFSLPQTQTEFRLRYPESSAVIGDFIVTHPVQPGVQLAQAQAELKTLAERLAQNYPRENAGRSATAEYWSELAARGLRRSLLILSLAVGFILLIACANLANLMLARGAARMKELTIRAALGASRWRLLRQMLTESSLLSLLGGGLGLLLAAWSVEPLLQLSPGIIQYGKAELDWRVLAFTLAVTLLTGVLTGLAPALQFGNPDLNSALKEGGRAGGESPGWRRTRGAFVVLQVALSFTLLVGAGLLLKSFYKLLNVDPGFKPENVLTFEYRLPRNKYNTSEAQWNFHRQVTERLKETPGVESVALARGVSFTGNGGSANIILPDRARPERGKEPRAQFNTVTANYFATMGIPFVRGRLFYESAAASAINVL